MAGASKPRSPFKFTDARAIFVPGLVTVSALLVLAALRLIHSGSAAHVQAAPARSSGSASGFRIIFGLKDRTTGKSWSGSIIDPAQVWSIQPWHFDDPDSIIQPNRWIVTLRKPRPAISVPPVGIVLDPSGPADREVRIETASGSFSFTPARVPYGKPYFVERFGGDVVVERVPLASRASTQDFENDDPALLRTRQGEYWLAWSGYKTRARNGFFYTGGDEVLVARSSDGRAWSAPVSITPPGDHFRVALGEDQQGRIWCVYSEQKKLETGNFDLFARAYDGRTWSAESQLTSNPLSDVFHRMISDSNGNLYLVWMSFRPLPSGGPAQSDIVMSVLHGSRWGEEIRVTDSAEDDWDPSIAADSSGRVWIAWDSYRKGRNAVPSYDVLMRNYANGQLGPVREISATPLAEMRADVAVDAADRV
jgi:hypothetical protein